MTGTVGRLAALTLLAAATPVDAQQRAAFVALPFENSGSYGQDKEIFEALELGVPALLARALARQPGAAVAEPERVTRALEGAGVSRGQRVDAATAAQVARTLGARYAVTGGFSDFYGKFRINARVVDAQSGEILKVVANEDPRLQDRAQLSASVDAVARKVAEVAGLEVREAAGEPVPIEAINDYSRGLLHESRGDRARALEFYQRAARAAPGLEDARAGVRRSGGT